jgi:site-specific DNA-methyltransferase (adenine-specific)
MKVTDKITITNEDNMELMARYPDNYFDLAIVDPPYGIGEDGRKSKGRTTRKDGTIRNGIDKRNGATIYRKTADYSEKQWDEKAPDKQYFNELIRVSKNQIIFGANHFIENIPNANSSGWIVWNKVNGNSDFSDCELAWTSFNKGVRKFDFMWNGMMQGSTANGLIMEGNKAKCEKRIHPTQKPIRLYEWILDRYAKEGDKILDTHLGSGSIAIACHNRKFDLTACELDEEYYNAAIKRINNHTSQLQMF